jgi:hypothetical protein
MCPCGTATAHLISYLYRSAARTLLNRSRRLDVLQLISNPVGGPVNIVLRPFAARKIRDLDK